MRPGILAGSPERPYVGDVRRLTMLAAVAVLALLPSAAHAANASVATAGGNTWNPVDVTINQGEKVTWSNPTMGPHNLQLVGTGQLHATDSTNWSQEQTFATA